MPKLEGIWEDHNGCLVSRSFLNTDDTPGSDSEISCELLNILNLEGINENSPIAIKSNRYEEYSQSAIIKEYKCKGAECEIIDNENEEQEGILQDEKDRIGIISYSMLMPLWFLVYKFFETYSKTKNFYSDEISIDKLKNSDLETLKSLLVEYDETTSKAIVSDDIFILDLSTGSVFNIGC